MSNDWQEAKRKVEKFQEMMERLGLDNDYWTPVEPQKENWEAESSSIQYGRENDRRTHH